MRNRKQEIKEAVLMIVALAILIIAAVGTIYAQVREPSVRVNVHYNQNCYSQNEAKSMVDKVVNGSEHSQVTLKICVQKGED